MDRVQYEIELTLNLLQCLPQLIREKALFRFASNSRVFGHLLNMARLQSRFTRAGVDVSCNSSSIEGLEEIQKHYSGKQPLVL